MALFRRAANASCASRGGRSTRFVAKLHDPEQCSCCLDNHRIRPAPGLLPKPGQDHHPRGTVVAHPFRTCRTDRAKYRCPYQPSSPEDRSRPPRAGDAANRQAWRLHLYSHGRGSVNENGRERCSRRCMQVSDADRQNLYPTNSCADGWSFSLTIGLSAASAGQQSETRLPRGVASARSADRSQWRRS